MDVKDLVAIVTVAGPVVIAVAAGLFTVWAGKGKTNVDAQGMLNVGFDTLIKELQKERSDLSAEISVLRVVVSTLTEEAFRWKAYALLLEADFNRRSLKIPVPEHRPKESDEQC